MNAAFLRFLLRFNLYFVVVAAVVDDGVAVVYFEIFDMNESVSTISQEAIFFFIYFFALLIFSHECGAMRLMTHRPRKKVSDKTWIRDRESM